MGNRQTLFSSNYDAGWFDEAHEIPGIYEEVDNLRERDFEQKITQITPALGFLNSIRLGCHW